MGRKAKKGKNKRNHSENSPNSGRNSKRNSWPSTKRRRILGPIQISDEEKDEISTPTKADLLGQCKGAEYLILNQNRGEEIFDPFIEFPVKPDDETKVNIEDSEFTILEVSRENAYIGTKYLSKRTDGAVDEYYRYLNDYFREILIELIELYGEENIRFDPRAGLRYGGFVFANCKLEEFYAPDGIAEQLKKSNKIFKEHFVLLEIMRNFSCDCDRLETYKGLDELKTVLNESLIRKLHFNREQWEEWLDAKDIKVNIDIIWKYYEELPIMKDFRTRVQENKQKFEQRIKHLGYSENVWTAEQVFQRKNKQNWKTKPLNAVERNCLHCTEKAFPTPVNCGNSTGLNKQKKAAVGCKGIRYDHIILMLEEKMKRELYVPRFEDCVLSAACKGRLSFIFHEDRVSPRISI